MGRRRTGRSGFLCKGAAVLIIVGVALCLGVFLTVKLVVEPNLETVVRIRAEVVVSRAVNKALNSQFASGQAPEDLIIVKKDEDGTMEMVQADSMKINNLMSQLSGNLQKAFAVSQKEFYDVPVGSLLGSQFLSQVGPTVKVEIVPMSLTSMDFRTEFETGGINQTKYKIYIVLGCRVKVIAPFSSKTFETTNIIPVAEAVILGDVPHSYVEVPEEDILDVIDE